MEELSKNPLIRRSQIRKMQKERKKIADKECGSRTPWKGLIVYSAVKVFTTKS